jgi:hypothetical protein
MSGARFQLSGVTVRAFVKGLTVNFRSFVPPVRLAPTELMPEELLVVPPEVVPPVVAVVELFEVVPVAVAAGTLDMTRAVKLKSTVFGFVNLMARVALSSFGTRSAPKSCE